MKVSIIGAGKVGKVFAKALKNLQYNIISISSKSNVSADDLAGEINCEVSYDWLKIAEADIIFITTNDGAIKAVMELLKERDILRKGQFIFHCSGVEGLDGLSFAKEKDVFIGSIHPLQSFVEEVNLKDVYFALDGDVEAIRLGEKIVNEFGGKTFIVPSDKRAIYHAAACIASNYFVTLIHSAIVLFEQFNMEEHDAIQALLPLIQGSIDNIKKNGCGNSLTGPISRGDIETVTKHIKGIKAMAPDELDLYKIMGKYTADLARKYDRIDEVKYEQIKLELE